MDETDVIRWFKHGVLACFFTVPASLFASVLGNATSWYEWPWVNALLVGLLTLLVILVVHAIIALWEWATNS